MDEDLKKLLHFTNKRDWQQFHTPKNLAISLAIEAAEILELFQWTKDHKIPVSKQAELEAEIADVYSYLLLLAHETKVDIRKVFKAKLKESDRKYPVSKSKGTAKKYSEL